jgi:hypothetical protein
MTNNDFLEKRRAFRAGDLLIKSKKGIFSDALFI